MGFYTAIDRLNSDQVGTEDHISLQSPDHSQQATSTQESKIAPPTTIVQSCSLLGANMENFKLSWPWLNHHLPQLREKGWTRAGLFRRGKLRYPAGRWGVAWYDVWRRENLTVTIGDRGQLIFKFSASDRRVTQSAEIQDA